MKFVGVAIDASQLLPYNNKTYIMLKNFGEDKISWIAYFWYCRQKKQRISDSQLSLRKSFYG